MDSRYNGRRIRLVYTTDPFTRLKPGDEGTVLRARSSSYGESITVHWDSGSTLNMIPGEDAFELLPEPAR